MKSRRIRSTFARAIDGDLQAFGGPEIAETIAGRLRSAQIAIVARFTPAMMIANVINACILMAAFWNTPNQAFTMIWGFLVISLALFIYIKRRQGRPIQRGSTASKYAIRRAILNAFLLGILWAALPLWVFPRSEPSGQIMVIALSIGMLCGGALSLASIPVAGLAFVTPLIFASAIALSFSPEMVYKLIMGLLIVYAGFLVRAMFIYAGQTAIRFIAELEHELAAQTDALTQLPNRLAFSERLIAVSDRVQRLGETHCVLFLDLDEFKTINDTYGHAAGDEYLIQCAGRLLSNASEDDFVARLSGDEFAIILASVSTTEQAAAFAERILRSFQLPFHIKGKSIAGSVTIGIAMLPADGSQSEIVMQKADEALYAAKRDKRGTYRFFDAASEKRAMFRQDILHRLRSAMELDEFYLEFQPLMDIETGLTNGFEALLRWRTPDMGQISPADFVPIAEDAGLIHEIGDWVIRKAIAEAAKWPEHLRVAINVSAVQFRTLEITTIIEKAIFAHGISPDRIEIEITESVILADMERAVVSLNTLRNLGVRISLDDFGTGYSSMIHLVRLPFDKIKIDRFFVSQLATSNECRKIVRAILRLAQEIGVDAVAEGVETAEQLRILKAAGCKEAQGFFISRPIADVCHSEITVSCHPAIGQAA